MIKAVSTSNLSLKNIEVRLSLLGIISSAHPSHQNGDENPGRTTESNALAIKLSAIYRTSTKDEKRTFLIATTKVVLKGRLLWSMVHCITSHLRFISLCVNRSSRIAFSLSNFWDRSEFQSRTSTIPSYRPWSPCFKSHFMSSKDHWKSSRMASLKLKKTSECQQKTARRRF